MGGDINVDYQLNNATVRKLKNFEKSNTLKQIVTTPTRLGNKPSILDHIYTNNDNNDAPHVLQINISGHLPVMTVRHKHKAVLEKVNFCG